MKVPIRDTAETSRQLRKLNEILSEDTELDGTDLRVLLYLSTQTNFDGPVHISQMEMAFATGKWKTHISRAIKSLVNSGILIPSDKGVRASEWQINLEHKVKKSTAGAKALKR